MVMVMVDDSDVVVALQLVMEVELSVLVVLLLELVGLRDGSVVELGTLVVGVSYWAYSEGLESCGRVRLSVENGDYKEDSRGSYNHSSV